MEIATVSGGRSFGERRGIARGERRPDDPGAAARASRLLRRRARGVRASALSEPESYSPPERIPVESAAEPGHRSAGLDGLRPQPRSDRGFAQELLDELRTLLLDIRREHPDASVPLILKTLVEEGRLEAGKVSGPTVRRLYAAYGLRRRACELRTRRAGRESNREIILTLPVMLCSAARVVVPWPVFDTAGTVRPRLTAPAVMSPMQYRRPAQRRPKPVPLIKAA